MNKNPEFELFVFNGSCKISHIMPNNDYRFPPDNIIIKGSESIRRYWNMKNFKKRKKV